MSWATRRQILIIALLAIAVAGLIGIFYARVIYQAPSCMDHKQNEGEGGIDCGAPACSYLCSASVALPTTKFVRTVSSVTGRTDVIAYVDNTNTTAAKALPYTLELYDASNALLSSTSGTVDLPPSSTVPVFIAGAYTGPGTVGNAFITFGTSDHAWYQLRTSVTAPQVKNIQTSVEGAPRITAEAFNPRAVPMEKVTFIATVFGADGKAIAASSTVLPAIAPMSSGSLVFTWNQPFSGTVSRVEVIPVLSLGAP
jgi:hypothetical protein